MKDIRKIFPEIKEEVPNLSGVEIMSLAIFGSTARRENCVDSDVDLLVVAEDITEKK